MGHPFGDNPFRVAQRNAEANQSETIDEGLLDKIKGTSGLLPKSKKNKRKVGAAYREKILDANGKYRLPKLSSDDEPLIPDLSAEQHWQIGANYHRRKLAIKHGVSPEQVSAKKGKTTTTFTVGKGKAAVKYSTDNNNAIAVSHRLHSSAGLAKAMKRGFEAGGRIGARLHRADVWKNLSEERGLLPKGRGHKIAIVKDAEKRAEGARSNQSYYKMAHGNGDLDRDSKQSEYVSTMSQQHAKLADRADRISKYMKKRLAMKEMMDFENDIDLNDFEDLEEARRQSAVYYADDDDRKGAKGRVRYSKAMGDRFRNLANDMGRKRKAARPFWKKGVGEPEDHTPSMYEDYED